MEIVHFDTAFSPSLISAYIETFAGYPWFESWQPEWVARRIDWVVNTPGFMGLVAHQHGSVSGAVLGFLQPFKADYHFEVLELFVHPSAHESQLGKTLIDRLEKELMQYNTCDIYLVLTGDDGSEKLYLEQGYKLAEQVFYLHKQLKP